MIIHKHKHNDYTHLTLICYEILFQLLELFICFVIDLSLHLINYSNLKK